MGKKITGKCCWKEDGNNVTRAEGSGGVRTATKEAENLFSRRVRSRLAMQHLWDE